MAFNFQVLETERLRLEPVGEEYSQIIWREFTPAVTRYMIPNPFASLAEAQVFVEACQQTFQRETDLELVILERSSGQFLGMISALGTKKRTPELGIWLKESAWGHGYGSEALRALAAWLWDYAPYPYLLYPVAQANLPSRHLIEACGGRLDNTYTQADAQGQPLETWEYRLPRP